VRCRDRAMPCCDYGIKNEIQKEFSTGGKGKINEKKD